MPEPTGPGTQPSTGALGTLGRELWRGVRRARILLAGGVLLLLVAVPAVNDLDQLCRALGLLLLLLGALVVLSTAYATPRRRRPPR